MIATIVLAGYRRVSLLRPVLSRMRPEPLDASARWLRSRRRVTLRRRLWACVMPPWLNNN